MKDIKFRGKRIDNGEWVYGYYFKTPLTDENSGEDVDGGLFFLCGIERHCISNENGAVFVVDPETVGQYICGTDMYKAEIYDGDFLADTADTYGQVIRHDTQWRWDIGGVIEELDKQNNWAEIVGNIHDNPELMEE